jgi:DNA polymerase III epsilon subunit-like protein
MRYLVFDTETTGLPQTRFIEPSLLEKWPHIVQFSFIIYDDKLNELVEAKDYIVKLPENIIISEDSTAIHGITNSTCQQKGVSIRVALSEFFRHLLNVDALVGHNIDFDINMIRVELLRMINDETTQDHAANHKINLHFITNYKNVLCTMKDSIELCNIQLINKSGKPYLKYPKLLELHEKLFNQSPTNLHNSFIDILVTLRCFMKLKHNIDLLDTCKTFKKYSNQLGIM